MRVLQVMRRPSSFYYSIENVFSAIKPFFSRTKIDTVEVSKIGINWVNLFGLLKYRSEFDVFHVTGDVHYTVFAFPRKKVVLTIHDCIFLQTYSGTKRYLLKKILLDWPVKYAGRITTISEKSKNEILAATRCDPNKIVVIPNPVKNCFVAKHKSFNVDRPRILFLGKTPNKNLDRVIVALRGVSCVLNIVGKPSNEQLALLKSYEIEVIIESFLTEKELAERYVLADIVLFPSYYEGFGLPILEAFKSERVVITSDIDPMKSVAAGGAYLVNPFDANSICDAVREITDNEELRNKLIPRGREVVKRYDPSIIASRYEQVYLNAGGDIDDEA